MTHIMTQVMTHDFFHPARWDFRPLPIEIYQRLCYNPSMTGKKYLQSVRDGLLELRILEESRAALYATLLPHSVEPKVVDVQESVKSDRMASFAVDLDRFDRAIPEAIDRIRTRKEIAFYIISLMENVNQRNLLTLYYLTPKIDSEAHTILMSWEDVASRLNYTLSHTHHIHRDALRAFEQVMSKS